MVVLVLKVFIIQAISLLLYVIAFMLHFLTYKIKNSKLSITGMVILAMAHVIGITALFFVEPTVILPWTLYLLFSSVLWLSLINRYNYLRI